AAGYTMFNFTVSSGVTFVVGGGGTAYSPTVSSGGTLEILNGASVPVRPILLSGATEIIGAGYSEAYNPGTVAPNGAVLKVLGAEDNATIMSGGTEIVSSGGFDYSPTVSGLLEIKSGGTEVSFGVVTLRDSGTLQLDDTLRPASDASVRAYT